MLMMHIWKTLKVFVSSTFKDLEKERDRLAGIFQKIQERIFAQRLHLIPYDLRWKEQSDKDLVHWCLKMVREVDYFIGIIGYRYGWRPPYNESGKENTERYSITEMEIQQALQTIPKDRRFFCFADMLQYSGEQLKTESQEDLQSLDILKQKLEKQGEKIFLYHNSAQALDLIYDQMFQMIHNDYPEGKKAELESYQKKDAIREIIMEKRKGFVGRGKYLEQICRFASEQSYPNFLVIHAVAGTGKSALLAQFYQNFLQKFSIPAIVHYMSMAGDNRSLRGILQSIGDQLKDQGLFGEEMEVLPEKLLLQLRAFLQYRKEPLLLLIDGLDESDEDAQRLSWLPFSLPACVRVVISTRPVDVWHKICQNPRSLPLELPPLEKEEIEEIIQDYLKQNHISLGKEDELFLAHRAAGNPLFLKVALDETIQGGVAIGQMATTVDALFHQILQRLCASLGKKIIHDYLGLIAASRYGLTEAELHEIIQKDYPSNATEDFFILVSKALANFIVCREKTLHFFHPEFERSVKMLLGKGDMRCYHRRLSSYFESTWCVYERSLLELPYQLQSAELYSDLLRLLCNIAFMEKKATSGMLMELRQDFHYALEATDVPLPSSLAVEVASQVYACKDLLPLIAKMLDLDFNFLLRHPQCLFQSFWNQGYWHDSPEAAHHYEDENLENLPWNQPGVKLYKMVEFWKDSRQKTPWIQSLRPLPERLDSPLIKIFRGHEDFATAVCFTPDDRQLVSGGYDKALRVWDIATGDCTAMFLGHEDYISCLDISSDGILVASGSGDSTIRIWDIKKGECLAVLKGHNKTIASLKFTPDGKKIFSAGKDKKIHIWNCQTWEQAGFLEGHENLVNSIAVSHDGKYLVSGAWDNTVRLWDIESKKCLWISSAHSEHVRCVAISPDSLKIASGSDDRSVRIWDLQGECLATLPHDSIVFSILFSHDGKKIITGDYGVLSVWNLETFQSEMSIRGHESSIFCLSMSQDNQRVVSCSSDKTIRMWDIRSKGHILHLASHSKIINSFNLSENAQRAVTASRDNSLMLWDTATGKRIMILHGHEQHARSACFSASGSRIISVADDKTVKIWDSQDGKCIQQLSGHEKNATSVFATQDGQWIVSGDRDGSIRLWDSISGQCILQLQGHKEDVRCLYIGQNRTKIISGGEDRTVRIWDIAQAKCLSVLAGHREGITGVAISQDEKTAYSTSRDGEMRIWNIETQEVQVLAGTGNPIQMLYDFPYIAISQDWETIVFQLTTFQPCLFFPANLRQAHLHPTGIMGGYAGIHTYILRWKAD